MRKGTGKTVIEIVMAKKKAWGYSRAFLMEVGSPALRLVQDKKVAATTSKATLLKLGAMD
jgi:hypothetical protein